MKLKKLEKMSNGYLATLWQMWTDKVIEPSHVIKALAVHGYELGALTNGGIVATTATERFEYKHGVRA